MRRSGPLKRKTPLRTFIDKTNPVKRIRARAKPTAAKPAKSKEERLHHARVALMPCIACGGWPVEVHHVRHDGRQGISRNHKIVVPACPACHRTGPNAVHTIGSPQFDELHGFVQFEIGQRLWEERHGY